MQLPQRGAVVAVALEERPFTLLSTRPTWVLRRLLLWGPERLEEPQELLIVILVQPERLHYQLLFIFIRQSVETLDLVELM